MRTELRFSRYRQSTIGFARPFDSLQRGNRGETSDGYPPLDLVKKGDDGFRIDLAIAGYRLEDV